MTYIKVSGCYPIPPPPPFAWHCPAPKCRVVPSLGGEDTMGSCGCLHRGARCPSQFFARQEAWPPSTSALWGAMVLVARPPPTLNWLVVCAAGHAKKRPSQHRGSLYACWPAARLGLAASVSPPTLPLRLTQLRWRLAADHQRPPWRCWSQAGSQPAPRRLPEKLCPTTGRAKLKRTPALACVLHVICTLCVSLYMSRTHAFPPVSALEPRRLARRLRQSGS